ncbi:MAG: RlmE family RNA methyltransferase [Gammaproteobacteria bacterium]|nr:RlmE family RNA methyltransferase [Gammaproteobacteria bacterium]
MSRRWLHEHHTDRYVKDARAQGYRSRAAFKLKELVDKDQLLKPGMRVVDLGAAPGGWSQVAAELVGPTGQVIATDILPMDPIAGVHFVQGDFTEPGVFDQILALVGPAGTDVVISDMAPNISGVRAADQARSLGLAELAAEFAFEVLKPGGSLLFKIFQGGDLGDMRQTLQQAFTKVSHRKPAASRSRSSEFYVLAKGFKGRN